MSNTIAPTSTIGPSTDAYGDVTSYLPLTTVYTAPTPTACASSFFASGTYSIPYLVAYQPFYSKLSCLPPAASTWWEQSYLSYTYLNIGPMICPAAYSTAWSSTMTALTGVTVACCPSGYTFSGLAAPPNIGECGSNVYSGQVLTYAYQYNTGTSSYTTITTTMENSSVVYAVQINGFSPLTSSSSSSSTTPTMTSATPSATTSAASNRGMPESTKIAIGVGVALGVLLFLSVFAAAFWLGSYRRRRRQQPRSMVHEIYPESEGK